MERITFDELRKIFFHFNEEHSALVTQFGECYMTGAVVYKASNWPLKDYSLEARTYIVRSDNKGFMPGMGGNSIFADSMDGTDVNVRLDFYEEWEVDYCYIMDTHMTKEMEYVGALVAIEDDDVMKIKNLREASLFNHLLESQADVLTVCVCELGDEQKKKFLDRFGVKDGEYTHVCYACGLKGIEYMLPKYKNNK